MSLVLNSTGGGSVTINEPTTASNFTQTLPAATGEVMVSGNMPAFSAYLATNQTVSNNTTTTIQYGAEQFDTASCFSTSTYRFTPNVAGYYCLTAYTTTVGTSNRAYSIISNIRKNGSSIVGGEQTVPAAATNDHFVITPTTIVYANGTTDYFDVAQYVYDYTASSSTVLAGIATYNQFTGFLVRAA